MRINAPHIELVGLAVLIAAAGYAYGLARTLINNVIAAIDV